jgi:hypothetical protein
MIRRLFMPLLLSIIVIGGSASFRPTQSASPQPCAQDREVWLTHLTEKMETIKPGMTRWDVLKIFRTDGGPPIRKDVGLPTLLRQTFVSQDSPYFKIDVEFKPFSRVGVYLGSFPADNLDVIVKVSKPYVQFASRSRP